MNKEIVNPVLDKNTRVLLIKSGVMERELRAIYLAYESIQNKRKNNKGANYE